MKRAEKQGRPVEWRVEEAFKPCGELVFNYYISPHMWITMGCCG